MFSSHVCRTLATVGLLLMTVPSCSPVGEGSQSAFPPGLPSQAVPALVSYYMDCGSFPPSTSGWKAMYANPYNDAREKKWHGPYLSKDAFTSDQTALKLLNGSVRYNCEDDCHIALLTLYKQSAGDPHRTIRLLKMDHKKAMEGSEALSKVLAELRPVIDAITKYRAKKGEYPESLELVTNEDPRIADTKMKLERAHEHLGYRRPHAMEGFTLFFFGEDSDLDCKMQFLFVTGQSGEPEVFIADSVIKR